MNWQDVYKLPLHNFSSVKAFSANSIMAYDYLDWKQPQEYYDHIIAIINGDIESNSICQCINEGCIIFKVKNENSTSTFYLEDNMKYVCTLCGYVYDDEVEETPKKRPFAKVDNDFEDEKPKAKAKKKMKGKKYKDEDDNEEGKDKNDKKGKKKKGEKKKKDKKEVRSG